MKAARPKAAQIWGGLFIRAWEVQECVVRGQPANAGEDQGREASGVRARTEPKPKRDLEIKRRTRE